jgi:hypothetical protein
MKKIVSLVFLLVLSCESFALGINTGNDLLNECSSINPSSEKSELVVRSAEACINFLMGFDSGQAVVSAAKGVPKLYCRTQGSNIGDMVNLVVSFLKKDKQLLSVPAGIAAWKALSAGWPCD